jgi:hypothetical protein
MTKFKPGVSGNPLGRPKGSKNKRSNEIRQAFLDVLNDNVDRLRLSLDNMPDDAAARLIISLMKHLTYPEVSPERLSETQLEQVYEYFKNKIQDEKI